MTYAPDLLHEIVATISDPTNAPILENDVREILTFRATDTDFQIIMRDGTKFAVKMTELESDA